MPAPRYLMFALGVVGAVAVAASAQTDAIAEAGARRLASHFAQTATIMMETDAHDPDIVLTAHALVREATMLVPDDLDLLRFRLALDALVEDGAGYEQTLVRLSAADPADEVVRLKRLRLALERYQVADDRIRAYEQLLRTDDLDPAIASRLALDLALLHRRRGDVDAFADALARSVALDPSHRGAVAIATGFFRMNVEDAEAEAELLVALLHADPTDLATQGTLARLLLDHGAYHGAARMHEAAFRTMTVLGGWPPDQLVADLALAHLAEGRSDLALRAIEQRQRALNEQRRTLLRRDEPDLNALDRAQREGVLHPTLGAVRAAVLMLEEDPRAATAAADTIAAYDALVEALRERERQPPPERLAAWRLHQAFVAIALAHDVTTTRRLLDEADGLVPLSDDARRRFEGWIALRSGDPGEAARLLAPLAADDPVAAIGLAETELVRGRRRDAARLLLAAATSEPGTLVGVWAGRRLVGLLGRRVPISDEARRLEALVEGMPRSFDMMAETPSLAVGLDVVARRGIYAPHEPILVDVTITNNAHVPLAIDRDGPIRPQIMIQFETTFNRRDIAAKTPPIIIDIDRRLRLEPRERLVVPVDLRRFQLGQALNEAILVGAFVRVRVLTNFVARSNGAVEPGLLGVQDDSTTIRIEGERVTPDWVLSMANELSVVDSVDDLTRVSLLGHVPAVLDRRLETYEKQRNVLRVRTDVGSRKELELLDATIDEHVRLLSITSDALLTGYRQLDDVAQAWLIAVLPIRALPEPLRQLAQRSDSRIVRLSYLLFKLEDANDPMLDTSLGSSDPTIRRVAQSLDQRYRAERERGSLPDLPQ